MSMAAKPLVLNVLGGGGAAAPFSPLDIPGLALWLDASDSTTLFQDSAGTTPATADNDVVGRMSDKSGNGYHAVQATTANKPVLKLAQQNGRNILHSVSYDFLTAPVPGTSQPFTYVAAWMGKNAAFSLALGGPYGGVGRSFLGVNAITYKFALYAGVYVDTAILSTAQWVVQSGVANTVSSKVKINDDAPIAGDAGTNSTGPVGVMSYSGGEGATVLDSFGEGMLYNRALTDAELTQVHTYLNEKWAVY